MRSLHWVPSTAKRINRMIFFKATKDSISTGEVRLHFLHELNGAGGTEDMKAKLLGGGEANRGDTKSVIDPLNS